MSTKSEEMYQEMLKWTRKDKDGNLYGVSDHTGFVKNKFGRARITIDANLKSPTDGNHFLFRMLLTRFFWTMTNGVIPKRTQVKLTVNNPMCFSPEYMVLHEGRVPDAEGRNDEEHYEYEVENLLASGFEESDFGSWSVEQFRKDVEPFSAWEEAKYASGTLTVFTPKPLTPMQQKAKDKVKLQKYYKAKAEAKAKGQTIGSIFEF